MAALLPTLINNTQVELALPHALQLVKQLADDIREKVKAMGYERYKLIVQCELGEKKGQAINIVSRCLWDTSTDGFASESYESETLFCNCQVWIMCPHQATPSLFFRCAFSFFKP